MIRITLRLNKRPGGAANEPFFHGTDFPVLNLHAHACSLYSASKLLGLEFTRRRAELEPGIALGFLSLRFAARRRGEVQGRL